MFQVNVTIFTILWIVLAFIQKFKMGLWCTLYVLLVCGAVFLYNGKYPVAGYACIGGGIVCIIWLIALTKKQYDKYKYGK